MREGDLVRSIEQWLRHHWPDVWVRKIADRYTRGLPDLVAVFPSIGLSLSLGILFIEVKKPGGRRRPLQEAEGRKINRMRPGKGHVSWVFAESVDDVRGAIHKWYEGHS